MTHRERVAEALSHVKPDRCPWQATFTPEFAERVRSKPAPGWGYQGPQPAWGRQPL